MCSVVNKLKQRAAWYKGRANQPKESTNCAYHWFVIMQAAGKQRRKQSAFSLMTFFACSCPIWRTFIKSRKAAWFATRHNTIATTAASFAGPLMKSANKEIPASTASSKEVFLQTASFHFNFLISYREPPLILTYSLKHLYPPRPPLAA